MNALITHGSVVCATPFKLLIPRLGFRNLFRDGTVTVTSQHALHPLQLAFDGLTYDAWRTTGAETEWIALELPEAAAADYMAIAAHTLEGCTLTPQCSDDGVAWTNLADPLVAADNRPIVWEFDSVEKIRYRLLIEGAAGQVNLGAIHVGEMLVLPSGLPQSWSPPSMNEQIEYTNSGSEGGQSLGRAVVRRGVMNDVQSAQSVYQFMRGDWEEFRAAADLRAFFFWWAMGGKGEIVYGQLTGGDGRFTAAGHGTAHFTMKGINR